MIIVALWLWMTQYTSKLLSRSISREEMWSRKWRLDFLHKSCAQRGITLFDHFLFWISLAITSAPEQSLPVRRQVHEVVRCDELTGHPTCVLLIHCDKSVNSVSGFPVYRHLVPFCIRNWCCLWKNKHAKWLSAYCTRRQGAWRRGREWRRLNNHRGWFCVQCSQPDDGREPAFMSLQVPLPHFRNPSQIRESFWKELMARSVLFISQRGEHATHIWQRKWYWVSKSPSVRRMIMFWFIHWRFNSGIWISPTVVTPAPPGFKRSVAPKKA
jgi:hypothetical protein